MAKYSVLTFVFNDYDFIREPLEVSPDCEYVLVTDNRNITSSKWTIKYLPSNFNNASGFTKSFYVRYHPFKFVSTNVCIVLDGSNQIKKSLDKIVNDFLKSNKDICLSVHWCQLSPYDEYSYWLNYRNYDRAQYIKNAAMLKAIGLTPSFKGCFEAGFFIWKKTNLSYSIQEFIYNCIKKISPDDKHLDRLDQSILSAVINCVFPEVSIFPVTHQIQQSEYIQFYKHHTWEPFICKINMNNLWLRNKKVEVYVL